VSKASSNKLCAVLTCRQGRMPKRTHHINHIFDKTFYRLVHDRFKERISIDSSMRLYIRRHAESLT